MSRAHLKTAFNLSDAAKYRIGALLAFLAIVIIATADVSGIAPSSSVESQQATAQPAKSGKGITPAKADEPHKADALNVQAEGESTAQRGAKPIAGNAAPAPAAANNQAIPSIVFSPSSAPVPKGGTGGVVTVSLSDGKAANFGDSLYCGGVLGTAIGQTATSKSYRFKAERHASVGSCTVPMVVSASVQGKKMLLRGSMTVIVTPPADFAVRNTSPQAARLNSGSVRFTFDIELINGHNGGLVKTLTDAGPGAQWRMLSVTEGELIVTRDAATMPAGIYDYRIMVSDNSAEFDDYNGSRNKYVTFRVEAID
ncbi:hypothetical protein JNJ66_07825 [Candidatus Saccharibacteria bacterium]|nr:hypothetical protein [Candidatus Saccharibacteria bacterium]